jgi:hypothetical protein
LDLETAATEEEDFDFLEEDGAEEVGRGEVAEVDARTAADALEAGEAAGKSEDIGEVTDCDTQEASTVEGLRGTTESFEFLARTETVASLLRQMMEVAETCG